MKTLPMLAAQLILSMKVFEGKKEGMGSESNYSCHYQVKNEKSGFNYDSKAHYLIV